MRAPSGPTGQSCGRRVTVVIHMAASKHASSRAPASRKSAPPKKQPRSHVPTEATALQLEVLAGLHRLTRKLGRSPTTEQLAEHLGYADRTGAIKPLRALERLGLVVPIHVPVLRGYNLTAAGRKQLP